MYHRGECVRGIVHCPGEGSDVVDRICLSVKRKRGGRGPHGGVLVRQGIVEQTLRHLERP
jgi:hypothetical protein